MQKVAKIIQFTDSTLKQQCNLKMVFSQKYEHPHGIKIPESGSVILAL